jgi:hypothetical protein
LWGRMATPARLRRAFPTLQACCSRVRGTSWQSYASLEPLLPSPTSDLYVSGRRFCRKPQPSWIRLFLLKSTVATSTSSFSVLASLRTFPKESQTNEPPQNCSSPSSPARLTAATWTPFAMAWARWTVFQASCQSPSSDA